METDPFAPGELTPDPKVALPAPKAAVADRAGPLPRVQFVVELVGPGSLPAEAAAQLLHPRWHASMGSPDVWVTQESGPEWLDLSLSPPGPFDSVSLAWDLVAPGGRTLAASNAALLLGRASEFAEVVGRRAFAMPVPEDVDRLAQALTELREMLDVGFALDWMAPVPVLERDVWVQCARHGLTYVGDGSFGWLAPNNPRPLLSVTPIGPRDAFSLGSVRQGAKLEGATVGFSLPLCPSPQEALEASFHLADRLVATIGGLALDEEGAVLDQARRDRLRAEAEQARLPFDRSGLLPGSAELARLFA